jgi:hypothetical protein
MKRADQIRECGCGHDVDQHRTIRGVRSEQPYYETRPPRATVYCLQCGGWCSGRELMAAFFDEASPGEIPPVT